MPILPIIDLLILGGWSLLAIGGALKAVMVTTRYNPKFFGLGPHDCLEIAAVALLFALTLAARSWVKAHEPEVLAKRRAANTRRAVQSLREEMQDDVREDLAHSNSSSGGVASS